MHKEYLSSYSLHASRRRFLSLLAGTISSLPFVGSRIAFSRPAPQPKPANSIGPNEALHRLKEGNLRYASGQSGQKDFSGQWGLLSSGQNPFAAILSCSDSRVAPEYAFDTALGDLFVSRIAGNFVTDDVLGSLEYAVTALQVPLILVLGHDQCGAVSAAINTVSNGASVTTP